MKEQWFSNIAWGKLAGSLAFTALILNQLNTAPVPAQWHPWLMFTGELVAAIGNFILNPKTKEWVADPVTVESVQEAIPSASVTEKKEAAPVLTAEEAALLRQLLSKAGQL